MKPLALMRHWCFLCFMTLASFSVSAGETIVIAAENSWPPFSDRHGKGISYNLVKAAFSRVGRDFSIEVLPYARALRATEFGEVDACWNVTRQPTTEALFHFGEEPLMMTRASYFFPKDKVLDFSRPELIPDGVSIGVIIGYEYGDEYAQHKHRFREHLVNTQIQIINMLLAERIDAAIMFDEVANYHLSQMGLPQSAITKGAINHISEIYVAFSKKNPQYKELARELDQGLRRLRDSGEYESIFNAPRHMPDQIGDFSPALEKP